MKTLSRERFNAFVMLTRHPMAEVLAQELEWYANDDERVLAVLFRDTTDKDFCYLLLARDEVGEFRFIACECNFATLQFAWEKMREALSREALKPNPGFGQDQHPKAKVDLLTPIVADEKLHPSFKILTTSRGHSSGRDIIREMIPHLEDPDGNLVEQFQTTGFDARLWELYLFAYFREERLLVSRPSPAPDFKVQRFDQVAYVEAVTTGRPEGRTSDEDLIASLPKDPAEVRARLDGEIPIRFGSPLYSKLKKGYWKLHDVAKWPLVLAIADFHAKGSMIWTGTALLQYLYGTRHDFSFDAQGKLIISPLKIETHTLGKKQIPSGFFFQPEAENISAVLFSSSGTVSKFTRMGKRAGFGDPAVRIIRIGTRYKHDPNSALPMGFIHEVAPGVGSESWGEGLEVYHNPNARVPLPEGLFPSIAHHRFDNGQIRSHLPEFHPFGSITQLIVLTDEPGAAPVPQEV
jgi:hypothetical protein